HRPGHPVQIFIDENKAFQPVLNQINHILKSLAENPKSIQIIDKLKEQMTLLGQFNNHYHRKEKLFFPIMERYGHYTLARIMWGEDDRIRNLYKGTKSMMEKLPDLELKYVR